MCRVLLLKPRDWDRKSVLLKQTKLHLECLNFVSTESKNLCNSETIACGRKCRRTTEILWLEDGVRHSRAQSCHGSRDFPHERLDYYPDNPGIVFSTLSHLAGCVYEWKGLIYGNQMSVLWKYKLSPILPVFRSNLNYNY